MKKLFILAMFVFATSGCETVNEAGRSIETAIHDLPDNSRKAAKDIGDTGNKIVGSGKQSADEEAEKVEE